MKIHDDMLGVARAQIATLEGRVSSADSELRSAMDRIVELEAERDALRELAGELLDVVVAVRAFKRDQFISRARALGIVGGS